MTVVARHGHAAVLTFFLLAEVTVLEAKYCGARSVNMPGEFINDTQAVPAWGWGNDAAEFDGNTCGWLKAEWLANSTSSVNRNIALLPNIVFVKGVKVGGTTAAAIMHQIGQNYGMINLFVVRYWKTMALDKLKSCYTLKDASRCCASWSKHHFIRWLAVHRHAVTRTLATPDLRLLGRGVIYPKTNTSSSSVAPLRYFLAVSTDEEGVRMDVKHVTSHYNDALFDGKAPRPTFLWSVCSNVFFFNCLIF